MGTSHFQYGAVLLVFLKELNRHGEILQRFSAKKNAEISLTTFTNSNQR